MSDAPSGFEPREWRMYLSARLNARMPRLTKYSDYYDGRHQLQFATTKFREAFGNQLKTFSTNWCGLVVDSAVDRMMVEGFSFGDDPDAGKLAWQMWRYNRLGARSVMAHTEAVKAETAYVIVSPPAEGETIPRFTVEHSNQVIVAHDPADRRLRLAAYKRYWTTQTGTMGGEMIEVVYLPDSITVYRTRQGADAMSGLSLILPPGVRLDSTEITTPNPLGVVPVIPLENNPNLLTGGTSDLKPAIALNDAANKFFLDMIVASEFAAFPQRVIMGVEVPDDQEAEELKASLSRVWMFSDPATKIDSFTPADLSNYTNAIEVAVQHLAAQTRTPPHYLLSKLMNLSGDALKAAEAGLVHRVKRKFVDFGDGWETAIRLGFKWQGVLAKRAKDAVNADRFEKLAADHDAETLWGNPEAQQPSVIADSLVKKESIGWPQEMLFRDGGMSVQEVAQAKALIAEAGTDLTVDDVNVRRAAGVPFEFIWEEMGYTPDEVKRISELSPLPGTRAPGAPPAPSGAPPALPAPARPVPA